MDFVIHIRTHEYANALARVRTQTHIHIPHSHTYAHTHTHYYYTQSFMQVTFSLFKKFYLLLILVFTIPKE